MPVQTFESVFVHNKKLHVYDSDNNQRNDGYVSGQKVPNEKKPLMNARERKKQVKYFC